MKRIATTLLVLAVLGAAPNEDLSPLTFGLNAGEWDIKNIGKAQRCILALGLLLIFWAGLFPPTTFVYCPKDLSSSGGVTEGKNVYIGHGRTFLVSPNLGYMKVRLWEGEYGERRGYFRIDYYRVGLEWATIACLIAAGFIIAPVALKDKRPPKTKKD